MRTLKLKKSYWWPIYWEDDMPKPEQPSRMLDQTYDRNRVEFDLEALHRRLNDQLIDLSDEDDDGDLQTDYVAGDLGTAAEIATALNATNTRINQILEKLRLE